MAMEIQRSESMSPLEALITVEERLKNYERQTQMTSEVFFHQYSHGQLADDALYVDWANDYRHYLALRQTVDSMPLTSFIGAAPGSFANPEEADQFIRQERDAWDF